MGQTGDEDAGTGAAVAGWVIDVDGGVGSRSFDAGEGGLLSSSGKGCN